MPEKGYAGKRPVQPPAGAGTLAGGGYGRTAVSEGRPDRPNVWFWVAVAGAAIGIASTAPAIGGASGGFSNATPPVRASENTPCGALAKALVAAILALTTYLLQKDCSGGRRQPRPGSESLPQLPAGWEARWRPPPQESDPSVCPTDTPIREPPEEN
jgi:hypothetical protein